MKPLEGITILAVSQYGAGPFATLHLADLGAKIIKIEDPDSGGDVSRYVHPYAKDGDSLYFQALNRNKKSITLNLKTKKGRCIFQKLAQKSDAVFNNLRGDVPEKLGLTYPQLQGINPQIVTCSLSGFGTTGSMKSEPAYDYLLQAMLGHMSLTGDPEGIPEKYGVSMIDFSTGIMAALAIMVGVFQARTRGVGGNVDVSLFDTAVSVLNYLAAWNLNKGFTPQKTSHSAHPSLVPSQLFRTQDGYIVVMCNKEKFFPELCRVIGASHLSADDRYLTFESRYEHKDTLIAELSSIFSEKDTKHWVNKLKGKVPAAPVHSVEEGLQHPLIKERDLIIEVNHPSMGMLKMVGTPIKIAGYEAEYRAAPVLGGDNGEVYESMLGLSPEEIRELANEGII